MTTSNLELARECGFSVGATWGYFTNNKLDAFAARIRADERAEYAAMTAKGAKAWADVPDATAWVDELRGSATGDSGAPVQFSPVFEAWAKSLDMDLSRTPEFYGDCNTDYAWLAWQAATANERERFAGAGKPMPDDGAQILAAVYHEMDEQDGGNAPGHAHKIAGIWDSDNGAWSGKPCAWCLTWKKFTALIKTHGITAQQGGEHGL